MTQNPLDKDTAGHPVPARGIEAPRLHVGLSTFKHTPGELDYAPNMGQPGAVFLTMPEDAYRETVRTYESKNESRYIANPEVLKLDPEVFAALQQFRELYQEAVDVRNVDAQAYLLNAANLAFAAPEVEAPMIPLPVMTDEELKNARVEAEKLLEQANRHKKEGLN